MSTTIESLSNADAPVPEGPGIFITAITPPEMGWPVMIHCDVCRRTEILLCTWLVKPIYGDIMRMRRSCVDPEQWHIHEHLMETEDPSWPFPGSGL